MRRSYRTEHIRAAEAPLLASGAPLMRHAAYAVANAVIRQLRREGSAIPGSTVLVLAGPGNNGGDGLFAAAYLARRGLRVVAAHIGDPHASALGEAQRCGVRTVELDGSAQSMVLLRELAADAGVWIDALVGSGASGGLRQPMSPWIDVLNEEYDMSPMSPFVVAVDVPSGIDANSGAIVGSVLSADLTVSMGAPKPANLLPPARYVGGRLEVVDLGLDTTLGSAIVAVAEVLDADVRDLWPIPSFRDHKYTRGVLGMLTGSTTFPGAALLGVGAALAAGPGMVRYLGPVPTTAVYPEVVTQPGPVQAWVLGSGLEDITRARVIFDEARADGIPVVLDAGAIELIHGVAIPSASGSSDTAHSGGHVVLTPHAGELARLLASFGESVSRGDIEADPGHWASQACTLTGATVVCKGAIDVVASEHEPMYAQSGATPWRAVAGSGDIYAGLLGAMLATTAQDAIPAARVAAAAAHVHARASTVAARAEDRLGRPIVATDILHALPVVIDEILNGANDDKK